MLIRCLIFVVSFDDHLCRKEDLQITANLVHEKSFSQQSFSNSFAVFTAKHLLKKPCKALNFQGSITKRCESFQKIESFDATCGDNEYICGCHSDYDEGMRGIEARNFSIKNIVNILGLEPIYGAHNR